MGMSILLGLVACSLIGGNLVGAISCNADNSTLTSTISPTPTCTPSRPVNDAVSNGGFECGLAPWVPEDIVNTRHALTSPGDASSFAYEFDQVGPKVPEADMHPASVYQDIYLAAGVTYNLKFRTFFDKCTQNEGFVGVMINRAPLYTVDACDKGAGAFKDNLVQFTAAVNLINLRFEFLTNENPAVFKIDNVSVVPLH
ncbi:MAG: hypothetical protein LQ346_005017 [Caloplaca aetnensis]|nr:MAG: hypothetical protein LQ346_005017 [Caloplaca aetnensis]